MRIALPVFLLIGLTWIPKSGAQDTDPVSYFAEDATVVAGIRNLSKLFELDDEHPLKELGRHPAVKHIFGETFESMSDLLDEELLTDIGMTEEDLARAFPGRLAFGGRLDLAAKAEIEAAEGGIKEGGRVEFGLNTLNPDVAVIADCTLTEDELAGMIEGLLAHTDAKTNAELPDGSETKSTLIRERAAGITLFRVERKVGGVRGDVSPLLTLTEGVVIFGFSERDSHKGIGDGFFADVVNRVESGGREKGSMASTDGYLDVSEKFEGTDFYFYAPLERLASALEGMIVASFENAEKEGSPVGLFATKDGILKTLGLGDFKALSMAGTVVPDGFELFNEISFNERRGIIAKMLRYDDRGIELPDFAPEGLTAVGVSSMDFGGMLTEMLGAVKAVSPMASGMLETQIAQLEKEGLSIRDGIIGSLGTGIASFTGYASDEVPEDQIPSQMFVFNLSDPEGMKRALAGLRAYLSKMGLGEPEKREFMGETIYRMDEMAEFLGAFADLSQDAAASYAIVGNRLIVAGGERDFMEHGITSMKKKGAALDEDPAIEEAWGRWDDNDLVEFAYEDVATFLKSSALSASAGVEFSVEGEEGEGSVKEAVKNAVEEMPSVEDLHFYISSKTFNTPGALSGWMILAKKPK